MEIRKVEPVDFEFDRIFVNLMEQEPLEAAEKLLYAFMDAGRKNERLLADIELNIPDVNNVPTRLLFSIITALKRMVFESAHEFSRLKSESKLRNMVARQVQKDTVQAIKDLFGTLSTEQMDKLLKTIEEVRESMKGK